MVLFSVLFLEIRLCQLDVKICKIIEGKCNVVSLYNHRSKLNIDSQSASKILKKKINDSSEIATISEP